MNASSGVFLLTFSNHENSKAYKLKLVRWDLEKESISDDPKHQDYALVPVSET